MTHDGHGAQLLHGIHNLEILSWGKLPQTYMHLHLKNQLQVILKMIN